MTKRFQRSLLAGLGIALLSGALFASNTIASGTLCRPLSASSYAYPNAGIGIINTGSSNIFVSCSIPMDNVALTNKVNFTMYVKDNSSSDFSCIPYIYDQDGNLLVSGAAMTATGTGAKTLTGTATVAANVNSNVYTIQCSMPGGSSQIYTAKAYNGQP
jgi:hypothetical protein